MARPLSVRHGDMRLLSSRPRLGSLVLRHSLILSRSRLPLARRYLTKSGSRLFCPCRWPQHPVRLTVLRPWLGRLSTRCRWRLPLANSALRRLSILSRWRLLPGLRSLYPSGRGLLPVSRSPPHPVRLSPCRLCTAIQRLRWSSRQPRATPLVSIPLSILSRWRLPMGVLSRKLPV